MKKTVLCILVLIFAFSAAAGGMAEEERLTFATTDLNGNPVDESLLDGYDVIIFNVWEPWCSPCVSEMPDLERLYQLYKDKGVLVVGVVNRSPYGGYDPEEIIRETGVTYPILNYCSAFDTYCSEYIFPATFVIDGHGRSVDMEEVYRDAMLPMAREDAAAYAAGVYDEYLNDPAYAAYQPYFEHLKAAAEGGEEEILALAAYYAEDSFYGTAAFYGSLDEDVWEYIFSALSSGEAVRMN